MKRANRRLEYKLRDAEMLSVLRGEDNRQAITSAYKKLLINQFHDILPGSHIHPVYEDAMKDYSDIEKCVDGIIGTGTKYFNTLNFTRDALTFVPNKKVLPLVTVFAEIGLFLIFRLFLHHLFVQLSLMANGLTAMAII